MGCTDGRGDEKEHAQKSQVSIDTSHAFSLMFNIPSINELEPVHDYPADQENDCVPVVNCLECEGSVCKSLLYNPLSVPDSHKQYIDGIHYLLRHAENHFLVVILVCLTQENLWLGLGDHKKKNRNSIFN